MSEENTVVGHSEATVDPAGLDPRAGELPEDLSQEMVMLIQIFRELAAHQQSLFQQLADVLKSHMSRQNLLLDKIVFGIAINTAALECMLGPNQTMMYNSRVTQMHAVRKAKVEKMQAMLQARAEGQESDQGHTPDEPQTQSEDPGSSAS